MIQKRLLSVLYLIKLSTTQLIDRMVELVKDKRIEGICDIRDESGRDGMRLVIQVKRNHDAQVVRNLLYKLRNYRQLLALLISVLLMVYLK
jgi:DNA gyrase/topoisomerase IV subunit A